MPRVTPVRRQYLQIKQQHPDAILFFRLGDFYETFDQDAEIVATQLDVVLTSRSFGKTHRSPMAGVPHHAAEGYIAKLVKKGYKVAICEQIGSQPIQGLMPREVTRVVTPGTVVESTLLSDRRNNYIAALVANDHHAGIAYTDITTGEFRTTQFTHDDLDDVVRELDRLSPAELLLSDQGLPCHLQGQEQTREALSRYPKLGPLVSAFTLYDDWRFSETTARQALLQHLKTSTLAGYGCERLPFAIRAAGILIQYLRQNQRTALTQINQLATYHTNDFMALDLATRRSLELTETLRDRKVENSLLWVLDKTVTPMGARLLRKWLSAPLLDLPRIDQRLSGVEAFFQSTPHRESIRELLRGFGDLERLTNRVSQGIVLPRELLTLSQAMGRLAQIGPIISSLMHETRIGSTPPGYPLDGTHLAPIEPVTNLIAAAIASEPPAKLAKGGFLRRGYSKELDAIEDSVASAKAWVAGLERVERERIGIKGLKVGYNRVFGYYIEVTRSNSAKVPESYIRKQTLVNAERYITPELKEKEALILNAAERTLELEQSLYKGILAELAPYCSSLLHTARAVAHLDVYEALADVATTNRYVKPVLTTESGLEIDGGRHPVVELTLADTPFVPNNTHMSPDEAIHIITGPNMSGKSTYLRQVALIALMAQIGSFVPARSAKIGLVDRIFARVGAQDEIASGQSTFMVEMVELANILNHATHQSLLILDELGRGTSTYDGISIAWAVIEYLHNQPKLLPKTLFATHYHELTELDGFLQSVRNYNVAVHSRGDQVVFTHDIVPGGADRSYGIHVGEMAGLPAKVVSRAKEILADLEGATRRVPIGAGPKMIKVRQLVLFGGDHPLIEELKGLRVDKMTPLEALIKLTELQHKANE